MTPEVVAASAAWVYVPDDAGEVRTEEFHVIAYPLHWSTPTIATSISSARPAAEVVDAVLDAAAGLGRDAVAVWVTDTTRPAGLEELLTERGAEQIEHLDVLARSLEDLPALDVPDDVELRRVVDEQTLRDGATVGTEVFGGSFPDDESIAGSLRRLYDDSPRWVAYRAGRPVAAGGMTLVDGVARLWGGSVVEECRGTGLYRALLDVRLRTARDRGARFALVKGRVETSGPVLRRAGFERYGAERAHLLAR